MNILIIGSNFGSNVYLEALKNLKLKSKIAICSPNIYKKKIGRNIKKYTSYKVAFSKFKFDLIIFATLPKIQFRIIKYIYNKKIKTKGLILEKPISTNLEYTISCINYLKKINRPWLINFIFPELLAYRSLKYQIKKIKFTKLIYQWQFKQAYFKNLNKTWKIDPNKGGGLIKFYGIHIFYHLLDLLNLKTLPDIVINKANYHKKILTELYLNIKSKKFNIEINFSNNSDKTLHSINFKNSRKSCGIINRTKNWTKHFKFIRDKETITYKNEDRIQLTTKNLKHLLNLIQNNKKQIDSNYIKKIIMSHRLIEKIEKKVARFNNFN